MFVAAEDGKCVERLMLRGKPGAWPVRWLVRGITILSSRWRSCRSRSWWSAQDC